MTELEKSLLRPRSDSSLWGVLSGALILVLCGGLLVLSLVSEWKVPKLSFKPLEPSALAQSVHFYREGENLSSDLTMISSLLYGKDTDENMISRIILDSLVHDVLRQSPKFPVSLDQFHSPYIFLLRIADERPEWLLAVSTEDPSHYSSFLRSLHENYAESFSPGLIRERVLPGEIVYKDVIHDPERAKTTEEETKGAWIRRTVHRASSKSLISAQTSHALVVTNSDALLSSGLNHHLGSHNSLFVQKEAFNRFTERFPESSVLLHLSHMLEQEGYLGMQSYRCGAGL